MSEYLRLTNEQKEKAKGSNIFVAWTLSIKSESRLAPEIMIETLTWLQNTSVQKLSNRLHIGFKEAQTLWLGLEDKTSEVSKLYEGFSEEFIKAMLPIYEEPNNLEAVTLTPSL